LRAEILSGVLLAVIAVDIRLIRHD